MSGHAPPLVSVLVPARHEEQTLPTTLPAILKAARELAQRAEVLVITPPDSPALAAPPVRDPILRWLPTPRPGKFEALRIGADAAIGDTLLLVDADVMMEPDTFRVLAQPMFNGAADVVAGRIDLLPFATSGPEQLFERWALLSFRTWHELRSCHPDLLWALPGAIYGIRRDLFPSKSLVPIVDDASLGLHAKDLGAAFAYAPGATVYTPAPATWQGWVGQKLRSRRGWAALARLRPADVARLESTFRRHLAPIARNDGTAPLMYAQDRVLRFAARQMLRFERSPSGVWNPTRGRRQWHDSPDSECRKEATEMDQPSAGANGTKPVLASPTVATDGDGFRLITAHVADIDAAIRARGLERHAYELDLHGYTVIENALRPDATETLRKALLSIAEQDEGSPIDPLGNAHENRTQEVMLLLSRGGRPFEKLVLHPVALPLITYLLGQSCTISSVTGYIKGRGQNALGVHSDTAYVPDPLPPYAQLANVNYCLTDYTVADGCLRVVPGSHRYGHRPRDGHGTKEAVPVEAPAGAAIVFHGNTWHGAYPRTSPGLRLTLSALFCRMYMRPQERYDEIIDDEVLGRNPPRLRALVGKDVPTGWRSVADAERIVGLRKANAPTYYRTRSEHA